MKKEENEYFTVTDKEGNVTEYEILFTFDSEETKKSYIVFTNNEIDETGSIITFAATYDKNNDNLELKDIETEREWNLIENLLAQIEEKISE